MSVTSTRLTTGLLAVLTIAAGLAHLPVVPEHLEEAPYMGALFVAFAVVATVTGALLLVRQRLWLVDAAGVLCAAAVVAYAATRLVAFPQIGDDVGNWLEPWGVVSIALETAVVVLAAVSRRAVAFASRSGPGSRAEQRAVQQRAVA